MNLYCRKFLPSNYMISELFASMSLVRHNAQTHDSCLAIITTLDLSGVGAHGLFFRINLSGQIVQELL